MRRAKCKPRRSRQSGQSLIETAFLITVLLLFVFNVINFSYYFLVGNHLVTASRSGVQYSVQGYQTPAQMTLPTPGPVDSESSISNLTYSDIAGLKGSSGATTRVCSKVLGLDAIGTTAQRARCASFGPAATFSDPQSDPESPFFVLHRVDVQYTVTPLIPGNPFGIAVLRNFGFHRQVSMRALD